MYFGDYLIEKKIINSDQLVKALCYQLESLPSLIRVVWESQLVNSNELLDILKSQVKDDTDILSTLKKLNKIDDQKINELELKQMSMKIPLGEVLVKLQFVSSEHINTALKDFYENKFNVNSAPEAKPTTTSNEIEISEAALESLRELGMTLEQTPAAPTVSVVTTKPFIDQYLDMFTEKFKNKLKKLIEILNTETNGTSDISNYYNSLYRDLHLLKSTITLSELSTQEKFVSAWEASIEKVLMKSNDDIRTWCKNNLAILSDSIDLLWKSRTIIQRDKTDEALNSDENLKAQMAAIADKIT